jgi:hypothetical protein
LAVGKVSGGYAGLSMTKTAKWQLCYVHVTSSRPEKTRVQWHLYKTAGKIQPAPVPFIAVNSPLLSFPDLAGKFHDQRAQT